MKRMCEAQVSLLAEVGPNAEGPLPWVEREYTPVSSAKQWELGKCDLLVKVYPGGMASSWLARARPARVWLSTPQKTLHVPALVAEGRTHRPASVLLLLAGTGVVALPQLLCHRDPTRQLGIPTPRRDQLHVPLDVVISSREDDVLLLPQLKQWCQGCNSGASSGSGGSSGSTDGSGAGGAGGAGGNEARGVRRCTLLLTPPNQSEPPFPDAAGTGDAAEAEGALHGLPNCRILRQQLSADVLVDATARMPRPCRVVVSGPGPFNAAARRMLVDGGLIDEEDVTILSA